MPKEKHKRLITELFLYIVKYNPVGSSDYMLKCASLKKKHSLKFYGMAKKDEIINLHDKFFKAVFSRRTEAVSFLRSTLPPEVIQKIKPESIQLANTHYISKELQESMSDVVYTDFCKYYIC